MREEAAAGSAGSVAAYPLQRQPPAAGGADFPDRPATAALWRLTWYAVLVYLASRAVVAAGLLAAHLHSGLSWHLMVAKWDAHWYLAVAQDGYPASAAPLPDNAELRLAFFPLFPLLLRPVLAVASDGLLAATAVGAALGAAATVAMAHLSRVVALAVGRDEARARRTALRAAALLTFFPGAVVLSLAYTEGLAILLVAGCLYALIRRRWLIAGFCAGLATATRPNALALVVACAWASYDAIRRRGEWRSLLAPMLAPVGFLAFLGYLQLHVGDWRAWHEVEARAWHQGIDFSARLLRLLAPDEIVDHIAKPDWQYLSVLVGLGFVLVAVVVLVRWRPSTLLVVYTVAALSFCFLSSRVGPRPRMLMLALPLFLACADRLPSAAYRVLLVTCAALTVAMTYFVSTGRVIP